MANPNASAVRPPRCSFASAQDLMQHAAGTRLRTLDRVEVVIGQAQAERFRCRAGEHWRRLRKLRSDPQGGGVPALSEIYIPLAFGEVLKQPNRSRHPIFVLIERWFAQTVTEILQDIDGVTGLTAEQVQHLLPAPGATAMQVTRHCINATGRVLDLVRWLHPAETFHDTLRRQLRHGS